MFACAGLFVWINLFKAIKPPGCMQQNENVAKLQTYFIQKTLSFIN